MLYDSFQAGSMAAAGAGADEHQAVYGIILSDNDLHCSFCSSLPVTLSSLLYVASHSSLAVASSIRARAGW